MRLKMFSIVKETTNNRRIIIHEAIIQIHFAAYHKIDISYLPHHLCNPSNSSLQGASNDGEDVANRSQHSSRPIFVSSFSPRYNIKRVISGKRLYRMMVLLDLHKHPLLLVLVEHTWKIFISGSSVGK